MFTVVKVSARFSHGVSFFSFIFRRLCHFRLCLMPFILPDLHFSQTLLSKVLALLCRPSRLCLPPNTPPVASFLFAIRNKAYQLHHLNAIHTSPCHLHPHFFLQYGSKASLDYLSRTVTCFCSTGFRLPLRSELVPAAVRQAVLRNF